MAKTFLDDESPFTSDLLRTTAQIANLPDIQTARAFLAAYEPRDADEAMMAAQVVADEMALIEIARSATQPGLSVDELLRLTDAVIRLDRKIRLARRMLPRKHDYPDTTPLPAPALRLDQRLKAHFVDGGTSVHVNPKLKCPLVPQH